MWIVAIGNETLVNRGFGVIGDIEISPISYAIQCGLMKARDDMALLSAIYGQYISSFPL